MRSSRSAQVIAAFTATLVACATRAPVSVGPGARAPAGAPAERASAPTYLLGDVVAPIVARTLVSSGPNLVIVTGSTLQIRDGASRRVLASTELPEAATLMTSDGERLFLRTKTGVLALDAHTAKPLWTSPTDTEFPWSDQAVASDGVLVMKTLEVVKGKPASSIYVFDAASGRVRFKKDDMPYAVDAGGGRVFLAYNGRLGAYDAVTGAKAWSVEGPVARRVLADKDRVVVVQSSSPLLVLDAATGKELRRIEIGGGAAGLLWTRADALLEGDTLFLYVTKKSTIWQMGGPHENGIVAVDVARGVVRWSTPPLGTLGWRSDPKLVRADDTLVACADGGLVRVLDAATGVERGAVGTGAKCGLAATTTGHVFLAGSNAGGTSSWVAPLVTSSATRPSTTVVRVHPSVPSGERDEEAVPAGETARVFVGGVPAHRDDQGHYIAKTTARGTLPVVAIEGDFEDDCATPHGGVDYVDLPNAGGEVESRFTLGRLENICSGSN